MFTDVCAILCVVVRYNKAVALGTLTDEFKSMLVSKSVYEEMVDEDLLTVYREDGNSIMKSFIEDWRVSRHFLWIIPNLWKMLQN